MCFWLTNTNKKMTNTKKGNNKYKYENNKYKNEITNTNICKRLSFLNKVIFDLFYYAKYKYENNKYVYEKKKYK